MYSLHGVAFTALAWFRPLTHDQVQTHNSGMQVQAPARDLARVGSHMTVRDSDHAAVPFEARRVRCPSVAPFSYMGREPHSSFCTDSIVLASANAMIDAFRPSGFGLTRRVRGTTATGAGTDC